MISIFISGFGPSLHGISPFVKQWSWMMWPALLFSLSDDRTLWDEIHHCHWVMIAIQIPQAPLSCRLLQMPVRSLPTNSKKSKWNLRGWNLWLQSIKKFHWSICVAMIEIYQIHPQDADTALTEMRHRSRQRNCRHQLIIPTMQTGYWTWPKRKWPPPFNLSSSKPRPTDHF